MENNKAFLFIQEAAGKPDWMERIRHDNPKELTAFAQENGYECTFEDLLQVSRELLKGAPDKEVSRSEIQEAESSSVGGREGGYGSDSGFALASGVAAEILKKEKETRE